MRRIQRELCARPRERLPEIIEVSRKEFYGEGHDDSDRRIPDITKARTLLGSEPEWPQRPIRETAMRYYAGDDLPACRIPPGLCTAITVDTRHLGSGPVFVLTPPITPPLSTRSSPEFP